MFIVIIYTFNYNCPNKYGGRNLPVNVNFGGCNSTNPNRVSLTYYNPTLSSGFYYNGLISVLGKNLGINEESSVQLSGVGINGNINIDKFDQSVLSDDTILSFKSPHLRCRSFDIKFTRSNITSNTISISASMFFSETKIPLCVSPKST
ncbi:hypothetical protein ACTFIZ_008798 [Dictyostelium cf. discoideum]